MPFGLDFLNGPGAGFSSSSSAQGRASNGGISFGDFPQGDDLLIPLLAAAGVVLLTIFVIKKK